MHIETKLKVIVLIPIFKEKLDDLEYLSLTQCLKILNNHTIVLFGPGSLNTYYYERIFQECSKTLSYEAFDDSWFKSIEGYNKLMLDRSFYDRFIQYKFILIYQLDSYVFEDKLLYWCNKGYDYIGAPWTEDIESDSFFDGLCGNGGFSLRNTKSFHDTLKNDKKILKKPNHIFAEYNNKSIFYKIVKYPRLLPRIFGYKNNQKYFILNNRYKEDLFWSKIAPLINKKLKIATNGVAIDFAFETNPLELFLINKKKLPFGCHAWMKNDPSFWKNYIDFNFIEKSINQNKGIK